MKTFIVLASIAIGVAACGSDGPSATGTITVNGSSTLGSFSRSIDSCKKGDGITLTSGGVTAFAAASDPVMGALLEVPLPGGGLPIVVYAHDCDPFTVFQNTNGDGDGTDSEVNGSVTAQCNLPDGGTLVANVTFQNCL